MQKIYFNDTLSFLLALVTDAEIAKTKTRFLKVLGI